MAARVVGLSVLLLVSGCASGATSSEAPSEGLRSAEEVLAEQAESASITAAVGEVFDLEERMTVSISNIVRGGDDLGPWLVVSMRVENRGSEHATPPDISLICSGSPEEGGRLSIGERFIDSLPADTFDEAALYLLLPGDPREGISSGRRLPECLTPAWVAVNDTGWTFGDPSEAHVRVPDDLIAAMYFEETCLISLLTRADFWSDFVIELPQAQRAEVERLQQITWDDPDDEYWAALTNLQIGRIYSDAHLQLCRCAFVELERDFSVGDNVVPDSSAEVLDYATFESTNPFWYLPPKASTAYRAGDPFENALYGQGTKTAEEWAAIMQASDGGVGGDLEPLKHERHWPPSLNYGQAVNAAGERCVTLFSQRLVEN